MAFEDAFPLFHQGPRSDLTLAYVHADIGASGAPTINAAKTSRGFNITRTSAGLYALVFPKCKFCLPIGQVRPNTLATVAEALKVVVEKGLDATTGTVAFNTQETDDGAAAVEDPATGTELVFLVMLGF